MTGKFIWQKYETGKSNTPELTVILNEFKNEQLKNWELASNNYNKLSSSLERKIEFNGFTFKILFNEGRKISSSAKVDKETIANRKCFLCRNNLPGEQKAILFDEKYFILLNPFPVTDDHYTIAQKDHLPQLIINSFSDLLQLSRSFGDKFAVIYNGPKCGASAPDHLHFQALPVIKLPLFKDVNHLTSKYGETVSSGKSKISFIDDGLRRFFYLESDNKSEVENVFNMIIEYHAKQIKNEPEPMINIAVSYSKDSWKLILFFRGKHRPELFFKTGDERMLISPAAIDYSGLVITPVKKDFEQVNKSILKEIFNETSLNKQSFQTLTEKIKNLFQT